MRWSTENSTISFMRIFAQKSNNSIQIHYGILNHSGFLNGKRADLVDFPKGRAEPFRKIHQDLMHASKMNSL